MEGREERGGERGGEREGRGKERAIEERSGRELREYRGGFILPNKCMIINNTVLVYDLQKSI